MDKLYTKQNVSITKMQPKKETVSFLLNFSKVYSVIKVGKLQFENIAN
jgi:hypothetical protein